MLVGGLIQPFEKYSSNWIISLGRDEHKKYLKPPLRIYFSNGRVLGRLHAVQPLKSVNAKLTHKTLPANHETSVQRMRLVHGTHGTNGIWMFPKIVGFPPKSSIKK